MLARKSLFFMTDLPMLMEPAGIIAPFEAALGSDEVRGGSERTLFLFGRIGGGACVLGGDSGAAQVEG